VDSKNYRHDNARIAQLRSEGRKLLAEFITWYWPNYQHKIGEQMLVANLRREIDTTHELELLRMIDRMKEQNHLACLKKMSLTT
jgi:hypothetical protein